MSIEQYMNKSPKDIYDAYDRLEFAKREFRESARLFLSRLLMDTDEDNPYKCDITLEPKGTMGLSSLEMPHLDAIWQHPTEGWITFEIDGYSCDFEGIEDEELVQIINAILE